MQNEVIAKIDSLLKISEPQSNIETLKVELREIECSIKEINLNIKELKSSMNDDKYFDASAEIVDKNIEISLAKKIKSIKKSLEELENQIEKQSILEQNQHDKLEKIKKEIVEQNSFIEILKEKIASNFDFDKENFKTLLKENEQKLKSNEKELTKLTKDYEKIQGKLEVLSFSKKELKTKIDDETEKLLDVKANLLNKRGYVNNDLKKEDQETLELLEKKLKDLEDSKNRILENPLMIAEEAKNYLLDDDKTGCLKKVKELKDLISKIPYMSINGVNSSENLKIELENAEAKRDEFSSMINSKNYESVDTTLIKDRLTFIQDKKINIEKDINELSEKIKSTDTVELEDLNNRINYCENEVKVIEDKINEFNSNFENEELTLSKKSSLQAALDKKRDELANINKLLECYKNDRKDLITKSFDIEKNYINKLKEDINVIDKEIKELEKILMTSSKSKNTIEIENDKNKLKELNDNIKAIKKRQNLKKSPEEIYDEIELSLGTEMDSFENDAVTSEIVETPANINDLEQDNVIEQEEERENDKIDKTVIEDSPINSNELDQIDNEVTIDSLPVIDDEELNLEVTDVNEKEDKLKVINVESLEENSEDIEPTNNEFLIGDYIS